MKCLNCKKKFTPQRSNQSVCSYQCSIAYLKKKKREKIKKEAQSWKAKKRVLKEQTKTYTQRLNEARKVFQKWIRERDKNLPCISCGTTSTNLWDAGHYLKAELYSGLIFNEYNVHKQCRKCNRYLGGNELNYRKGLHNKIGIDKLRSLENSKNNFRLKKYTDEELRDIKRKYKI